MLEKTRHCEPFVGKELGCYRCSSYERFIQNVYIVEVFHAMFQTPQHLNCFCTRRFTHKHLAAT